MCRVLTLAAFILICPGCIAWEIRDEMRTVNRQLGEIDPVLVHTTKRLATVNADIGETNRRLGEVQASLTATQAQLSEVHAALLKTDEHLVAVGGTLGETNPQLTNLDGGLKRMQILNDVQTSLHRVDVALGPLSKTMGSLTSTMSILGLGGGSEPDLLEQEAASSVAAADPAPAPPDPAAAPATGAEAAAPAPSRPDLLVGTWANVFPDGAHVVAILADGRFLRSELKAKPADGEGRQEGAPETVTREGRWSREGRVLRFTFDSPTAPTGSPPATVLSVELISVTPRTLTVRADGQLRVYSRP